MVSRGEVEITGVYVNYMSDPESTLEVFHHVLVFQQDLREIGRRD